MSLRSTQNRLRAWANYNFPNAPSWQPLLGVGEEMGELFHAFLKRSQGIRGTVEEHRAAERDAIGDLLIYLMDFANREDHDIQECLEGAWEEIEDRDWQKFPRNGRTE
jgi:NTP pyrophosphatase (non-canonical NTP hydrolase)